MSNRHISVIAVDVKWLKNNRNCKYQCWASLYLLDLQRMGRKDESRAFLMNAFARKLEEYTYNNLADPERWETGDFLQVPPVKLC